MNLAYRLICPICGAVLGVNDDHFGMTGRCRNCSDPLTITGATVVPVELQEDIRVGSLGVAFDRRKFDANQYQEWEAWKTLITSLSPKRLRNAELRFGDLEPPSHVLVISFHSCTLQEYEYIWSTMKKIEHPALDTELKVRFCGPLTVQLVRTSPLGTIEEGTFMARTRESAFLGRPIEEAALACRRRRWLLDTMPDDDFVGSGPARL